MQMQKVVVKARDKAETIERKARDKAETIAYDERYSRKQNVYWVSAEDRALAKANSIKHEAIDLRH